jgi:hypothetical protein
MLALEAVPAQLARSQESPEAVGCRAASLTSRAAVRDCARAAPSGRVAAPP